MRVVGLVGMGQPAVAARRFRGLAGDVGRCARRWATAAMGARRLVWSRVVACGPHARAVVVGDRVLFDPEDKAEVEVQGETYVVMRERDVHAVAAERLGDSDNTGLYL